MKNQKKKMLIDAAEKRRSRRRRKKEEEEEEEAGCKCNGETNASSVSRSCLAIQARTMQTWIFVCILSNSPKGQITCVQIVSRLLVDGAV